MEWLDKVIAQLKRIHPTAALTNESSEAEVVDFMESVQPIEQALEDSQTMSDIIDRIAVLEGEDHSVNLSAYATTEALEASAQTVTALVGTEIAKVVAQVNIIKGKSSKPVKVADPITDPQVAVIEDEDVKRVTLESKDLFSSGQIIPGIL